MVRSRSRSAALRSAIWASLAVSRARSAATMLVSWSAGGAGPVAAGGARRVPPALRDTLRACLHA